MNDTAGQGKLLLFIYFCSSQKSSFLHKRQSMPDSTHSSTESKVCPFKTEKTVENNNRGEVGLQFSQLTKSDWDISDQYQLPDWLTETDLIIGVSWTGFNSKWWPGCSRSRAATLLLMKSLEHHSNSLNSEIPSNQSAANSGSVASAQNSFNKFSRSKGYYSQVLRVSWNIIGRRGLGSHSLQHLTSW